MRKCKYKKPLNIVAHEIGRCFLSLPLGILFLISGTQVLAGDSVQLNLRATIDKSCSLERVGSGGNSATLDSDDGEVTVELTGGCNTPFKYTLTSDKGGLAYTGAESVSANSDTILTQVDYTTRFYMTGLEDGDTNEIDQSCSSSTLANKDTSNDPDPECTSSTSNFAESGTSIAIGKTASLSISIDNWVDGLVSGNPLMAGTFQDELTLTISANP